MDTNYGARPGVEPEESPVELRNVPALVDSPAAPLCLECRRPLGDDECANERGEPSGVHASCWAAWCAGRVAEDEDRAVDRARDAELMCEGGAS